MTKKLSILLVLALMCTCSLFGQSYRINGRMTLDSLRFTPERITKLYLGHNDKAGVFVKIDSAVVDNMQFSFEGSVPEQFEMYFVSGFDNGAVPIFLEEGTINMDNINGQFPMGCKVSGTPANDTFTAYLQIQKQSTARAVEHTRQQIEQFGEEWIDSRSEETITVRRMDMAVSFWDYKLAVLEFLLDPAYATSPVVPIIMDSELMNMFAPFTALRDILPAVHPNVRNTADYVKMANMVKSRNMNVGFEAPDLDGTTPDGKQFKLSDLRGRYVLIDFWASWCGPCRREFPNLKEASAAIDKAADNNFAILSVSIDNDGDEWRKAIADNELKGNNWYHISDLMGWNSPSVTFYGVSAVPRMFLINPEGKIVSLELRGDAMVDKVNEIILSK